MKPPRSGLRPMHNKTHDVAKIDLRIPAGSTLYVQEQVADQLVTHGAFSDGEASAALLDKLDADHLARFPGDGPPPESLEPEPAAKPAKKVAAKKA